MTNLTTPPLPRRPRIGIALGSGGARGWAHVGVLRALQAAGIEPDVICGSSAGALVGGIYAHGHLDAFESWIRALTSREVMRYVDLALPVGGLLEGRSLMELYRERLGDVAIETLAKPYAAVATDLASGQEVWLQKGSLVDAIRASVSLPGLFKPVAMEGRWLVDGALVNPIPVTLCRMLGADAVIAVNLNSDLRGRHVPTEPQPGWLERLTGAPADAVRWNPGLMEVLSRTVDIMQDRITRSRLAGDPPEVVISPRVGHLELLEFARAAEAIEEGRACTERLLPTIREALALSLPTA